MMTWIVVLFLASWIGSQFQTAYDAHMRELNRLFGKNNYYVPTPAERMEDEAEKRKKRNENIWFWCILPIWIFAIYAIHTWG
jgi:hypothetical protein